MFLNQFLNIFNHKKSKTEREKKPERVSPSSSTPPEEQEENINTLTDETPPTSLVSKNNNIKAATISSLPEVEFEESRNLLQLDFFSDSNNDHQQTNAATFPKFDYLLQNKQVKIQRDDHKNNNPKKRKLSTTLRHRISLYRPSNKSVKRTLSTPDLCQK